jgi:predicted dinucleotide-binding enzyme
MCALLVGLPDVTVVGVGEWPGWLRIAITTSPDRASCCGRRAWRRDTREVVLVDLPVFGRPARLVWCKQRWKCPACGRTWTEQDPQIASARWALTTRAARWATRQVGRHGRSPSRHRRAAAGADVTILAVPFDAVAGVVPRLGLRPGDILVDATNPFGRPLASGAASGVAVVADAAGDGVRVVKAFNTLGAEHMSAPPLPGGHRPLLPVAADDEQARHLVAGLAGDMGFDAVEVTGLDNAGLLEEAARYWGLLAFNGGLSRNFVLVAHQRPPTADDRSWSSSATSAQHGWPTSLRPWPGQRCGRSPRRLRSRSPTIGVWSCRSPSSQRSGRRWRSSSPFATTAPSHAGTKRERHGRPCSWHHAH